MIYFMRLQKEPFKGIKTGAKRIELRLYDEKRRALHVGDEIQFTCIDSAEMIRTKVIGLHIFESFEELYKNLPLEKCGYTDTTNASFKDMETYYSQEEQRKYGVVGIELSLL